MQQTSYVTHISTYWRHITKQQRPHETHTSISNTKSQHNTDPYRENTRYGTGLSQNTFTNTKTPYKRATTSLLQNQSQKIGQRLRGIKSPRETYGRHSSQLTTRAQSPALKINFRVNLSLWFKGSHKQQTNLLSNLYRLCKSLSTSHEGKNWEFCIIHEKVGA